MIVVGSTLAPYKATPYQHRRGFMSDESDMWLDNIEQVVEASPQPVFVFAALELDARGMKPYQNRLTRRLRNVGGDWWTFSMDTGAERLDGTERLAHICAGRNLIIEYAMRINAEWVLFLDSDTRIPADSIPKLLELDWPIVGGDVPNYCLSGPEVQTRPTLARINGWPEWDRPHQEYGFPVQQHWNTAGFLMVHRDIFTKVRWRYETNPEMTDDPCYAQDAERLGWPTLVRKDLIGDHEMLVPVEKRGHDLKVQR